ncbi:MAG: hypothetical protein RR623_06470 [Bacilli bacterium]|uniref:N-acetyltransferase domain-containing protein n=1 Tax=Carnobacterium maltaromaticum TaxID=2751 RepID=A0AAW9JZB5_CARML|nr:hypothetical protein [Carnobacterium maltaromaticum]MDZ5757484.1 hypothetical protein [Carnobacterium maltaromaticum]
MSYTFITPQDKADFIFINECLLKKDFMSNISENPSENSFILIIKFKKKNIGIFIPSIHTITNIKYSRPCIYILEKYRNNTSISLCKAMEYLFETENVARVIIQVYSHNILMINCMNNLNITFRGTISNVKTYNNSHSSIHFYDIGHRKYQELRRFFSG